MMGGTRVIPGRGRICNEAEVVDYRDMVTIVRDRVAEMVHEGMRLPHVKATQPSLEYDGYYDATSGPWTTDASPVRRSSARGRPALSARVQGRETSR